MILECERCGKKYTKYLTECPNCGGDLISVSTKRRSKSSVGKYLTLVIATIVLAFGIAKVFDIATQIGMQGALTPLNSTDSIYADYDTKKADDGDNNNLLYSEGIKFRDQLDLTDYREQCYYEAFTANSGPYSNRYLADVKTDGTVVGNIGSEYDSIILKSTSGTQCILIDMRPDTSAKLMMTDNIVGYGVYAGYKEIELGGTILMDTPIIYLYDVEIERLENTQTNKYALLSYKYSKGLFGITSVTLSFINNSQFDASSKFVTVEAYNTERALEFSDIVQVDSLAPGETCTKKLMKQVGKDIAYIKIIS